MENTPTRYAYLRALLEKDSQDPDLVTNPFKETTYIRAFRAEDSRYNAELQNSIIQWQEGLISTYELYQRFTSYYERPIEE